MNRVNSSLCLTGFVKNPGHGTKFSPDVNANDDTETICVKNSVPNAFQTGQDTTDDGSGTTQTTVGNTTGKQPNSGTSKIKLTNDKLFQSFRLPRREVLSFIFFCTVLQYLSE